MSDYPLQGYPGGLSAQQVTIASGASASEMIATNGKALLGIFIPSSGWTAAAIGYKVCPTGRDLDLVNAYDAGGNLLQTLVSTDQAAAAGFIAIPQSQSVLTPFLQLTSVVAGATTAAAQAADRVLILLFRNWLGGQ